MPKQSQDSDSLRRVYISHAAYYWYRAPDLDGDLVGFADAYSQAMSAVN